MKIALLVLLGLVLGALGGAALGIGAGLAWTEIFQTSSFEGYSGMLVFFTFMPIGAGIGGLCGALLFGVMAIRDAEIAIERDPARGTTALKQPGSPDRRTRPHLCNAKMMIAFHQTRLFEVSNNIEVQHPGPASQMTPIRAVC